MGISGPKRRMTSVLTPASRGVHGPGEMQIIPPGVGHVWSEIADGGIDYMVIRIDPEHVLALSNGWPNPSAASISFKLDLPEAASVSWQVYDLAGRVVWSETQVLGGGRHELRWDTARGTRPGLYLARVRVAGHEFMRRVVRM